MGSNELVSNESTREALQLLEKVAECFTKYVKNYDWFAQLSASLKCRTNSELVSLFQELVIEQNKVQKILS